MKYKVGDEFIVKIKEVMDSDNGTLYRSNFNTLVFDEYGLDKLQKLEDTDFLEGLKTGLTGLSCKSKEAYEKGLADAWELARKIENKLDIPTAREIFDAYRIADILDNFTPQEALAKIEAYEENKAIKVGDVVYADDEPDSFGVVTWKYNNGVYVMWDDGSCGDETNIDELHKTGRTVDIEHLLEQIRGNE